MVLPKICSKSFGHFVEVFLYLLEGKRSWHENFDEKFENVTIQLVFFAYYLFVVNSCNPQNKKSMMKSLNFGVKVLKIKVEFLKNYSNPHHKDILN